MRAVWVGWTVALVAVLLGLGFQVSYADEVRRCQSGDLLALCAGPLANWLMPVSVAVGVALVLVGAWRLAIGPRP